MFLIHPPDGVPIATVPEVLRQTNSRKTALLQVNYFSILKTDNYLKRQKLTSTRIKHDKSKSDLTEQLKKQINKNNRRDTFGRLITTLRPTRKPITNLFSQIYFDQDQVNFQ